MKTMIYHQIKKVKNQMKNNDNNDNNQNNTKDGESVIIDQKEKDNNQENIEDKLNQPLTKKKLPPIEKNGENNGLENIQDIIKKIKNMDMVYLNGLMEKNIKDIGKMENKMEKGKIIIQEIMFGLKAFGKMERNKEFKKMKNIMLMI